MKLLIVDDSSVVRRAIERDLESGKITEVDQAFEGVDCVFRRGLFDGSFHSREIEPRCLVPAFAGAV